VKLLKFVVIGFIFVTLLYWYSDQVKSKMDNDESRNITKKVLTFGKQKRELFISTSANRLKDKKAPLIIFLHGMDGAWPNRRFTKPQYEFINKLAWKENFVAVFPQGTDGACNDGSKDGQKYMFYRCWSIKDNVDRNFILKLKDTIVKEYGTSSEKVFLIGFSNGGYFVSDFMIDHNKDNFAGFGIHSASGEINEKSEINKNKSKFLISINAGNKDEYEINGVRSLKKQIELLEWDKEKFNYSEYNAKHEMSKNSFEKEISFFLNKKD
jgi:poly(3-hydroxybutyrate) depolymerase